MSAFANIYAQKIYDIISPFIGDLMAKGAIRSQCKKLNIAEDQIQKRDIPLIAENIRKAMIMFVGSENANTLANKINLL